MADYGVETTAVVAEHIRARRRELGWSLEKLAKEAGLHRTTIGLVERNKTGITIAAASKIAQALGTDLSVWLQAAEVGLSTEVDRPGIAPKTSG